MRIDEKATRGLYSPRTFSITILMLVAASTIVAPAWPFSAPATEGKEFTLHKTRQVDKDHLFLYHDPVDVRPSRVSVTLSRAECAVATGFVPQGMRDAGESYATLIVLDRGGTLGHGMGKYSDEILKGVRDFLVSEIHEQKKMSTQDEFALVDAYGGGQMRKPQPTGDAETLSQLLTSCPGSPPDRCAPPPHGDGADIYFSAWDGLSILSAVTKPLKGAIIISDGRDPTKDASANAERLKNQALAQEIPIYALFIDRGIEDPSLAWQGKVQAAKGILKGVAIDSGGDMFAEVPVDPPGLSTRIKGKLDWFYQQVDRRMRTKCELCGNSPTVGDVDIDVDMAFEGESGTILAQSSKVSPGRKWRRANLSGIEHCADAGASGGSTSGSSNGTSGAGQTPWLPIGIGGVLALGGGGLLLLARSRKKEREREARRREEAERDTQRRLEQDRIAAQQRVTSQAPPATPAEAVPQPAPANAAVYRLVGDDGAYPVPAGKTEVGAAPDCDIRIDTTTVSSHHARLAVGSSGTITITDLGSSNGTFVNGTQIRARSVIELRAGDRIGVSKKVNFTLERARPQTEGAPVPRTRLED